MPGDIAGQKWTSHRAGPWSRNHGENWRPALPGVRSKGFAEIGVQYYFDQLGYEVAYRSTPQGPEVLAVGYDEILALTKDLALKEQLQGGKPDKK